MNDAGSENTDEKVNSGENDNINVDSNNSDKNEENGIVVDNSDKKEKAKQKKADKLMQQMSWVKMLTFSNVVLNGSKSNVISIG